MNKYIQTENCEATELDGMWLILDANNYTVTKLNCVGGFCWNALQQPHSLESLVAILKDNYLNFEDAQGIKDFIAELVRYGLIKNAT